MKMMPLLTRFLGILILLGISVWSIKAPELPFFMNVENEDREVVGKAFAIGGYDFKTADHVFETHEPLYFQEGGEIIVKQRDSELDVLIFTVPESFGPVSPILHIRHVPVSLGMTLAWWGGAGEVVDLDQSLAIEGKEYAGLMTLAGKVEPGDSGLPVYDSKNKVVGMIVGGAEDLVYVRPN